MIFVYYLGYKSDWVFFCFWLRVDLSFDIGDLEERAAFSSGWRKHVQVHSDLINVETI
jgi:hypothetical protein